MRAKAPIVRFVVKVAACLAALYVIGPGCAIPVMHRGRSVQEPVAVVRRLAGGALPGTPSVCPARRVPYSAYYYGGGMPSFLTRSRILPRAWIRKKQGGSGIITACANSTWAMCRRTSYPGAGKWSACPVGLCLIAGTPIRALRRHESGRALNTRCGFLPGMEPRRSWFGEDTGCRRQ